MPSLQRAIFEAATFRPCPLIVTNVEQSEWNTPHEFQPQAEPPTPLRHTTTLSLHCVLKEGGSTHPTLWTAILKGLCEWIDDQLEPITPIPICLRTKTFDPFLENFVTGEWKKHDFYFFLSFENFGKILSTWGSVVEVMPYLALYLSYVSAAHCLLCSVHAECSHHCVCSCLLWDISRSCFA